MAQRKDLDTADDLKESIAHLDQVNAPIARLLVDLVAPKPAPAAEGPAESPAGA